jgi:uncharacterized protein
LKAAMKNNADAQAGLGVLYVSAKGGPRDMVEGYMWTALAADHAIASARELLPRIAQQLTPPQLAQAKKQVKNWKPTAPAVK